VVDVALSRGFTAIVSGRSSYEVKIETGHKLVPLNNYCRHSNIFLHTIYRIVAQRIGWASLDRALARFLKRHPGSAKPELRNSDKPRIPPIQRVKCAEEHSMFAPGSGRCPHVQYQF
jgi:hypothetical protein